MFSLQPTKHAVHATHAWPSGAKAKLVEEKVGNSGPKFTPAGKHNGRAGVRNWRVCQQTNDCARPTRTTAGRAYASMTGRRACARSAADRGCAHTDDERVCARSAVGRGYARTGERRGSVRTAAGRGCAHTAASSISERSVADREYVHTGGRRTSARSAA